MLVSNVCIDKNICIYMKKNANIKHYNSTHCVCKIKTID